MNDAMKFVEETETSWVYEGLAIPYGGPMGGQDLTGTHFSAKTDLCLDWFPDGGRPILYRHGFDPTVRTQVVGREIGTVREDDLGRWVRLQIDKAKEYAAEIRQLADDGVLALSSGAVDHLVSIATKGGEISRWPWVELSLVPNPANPEALLYQVRSTDAIDHIRIVGADVPAELAAKDSEAADDATSAAWVLGSLTSLLGDESDEAQATHLRDAIAALQAYIAAEVAEVGTPEDRAETGTEMMNDMLAGYLSRDRATREGRRNSTADMAVIQGIHDASSALGAMCGEAGGRAADSEPAAVLAIRAGSDVEPVSDADLARIADLLTATATARAREVLRMT